MSLHTAAIFFVLLLSSLIGEPYHASIRQKGDVKRSSECKNLSSQLYSDAQSQFQEADVRIGAEATTKLKSFIADGISQMANAKDEQCKEAKQNFSQFMHELIRNAEGRQASNNAAGPTHGEITVASFNSAKNSVCPLFPFC